MFFMGKFTTSTGSFSIAMLNHQRVDFDTSKKGQKSGILRFFFFHRERYKICSPFPGVKTSCSMHCGVWMVVKPQEMMLYVLFWLKLAFGLTKNYPHIPVYICLWYLMQSQILWCLYGFQNLKQHICVLRGFPRSSHQRRPVPPGVPFLFQLHDPRLDGALDVLGW